MAKGVGSVRYIKHERRKRPGVHAKTKQSASKNSKLYFKKYVGQGR